MSDSGVQADGSWVPAFPGQRPPFELGHTLTVKHGAYSARLIRAEADALRAELAMAHAPWLAELDGVEVDRWLHAEAVCRVLSGWLEENGHIDGSGRPREASSLLLRWERLAADRRKSLGVTPMSRADMKTTAAVGAAAEQQARAALARRGAQARAAAEARVVDQDGSEAS